MPGSVAEVIKIRAEFPAGARVSNNHLLEQTSRLQSKVSHCSCTAAWLLNRGHHLVLQCLSTFLCHRDTNFLFFFQNFLAVLRVLFQDVPCLFYYVFQMGHLETSPQEAGDVLAASLSLPQHLCSDRLKYVHHTIQSSSHLHGKGPPRDGDHRAAVEVVGEFVAVHRGTHEDELQVRTPHHDVF